MKPILLLWAVSIVPFASSAIAEETWRDNICFADPEFAIPPMRNVFAPPLKALWLEALSRPETELKRQAANAIARAKRLGMPGLSETVKPLMETLDASDVHPLVALSVARALIILEAKEAAPLLLKQATTGSLQMAQLVTPTLVQWNAPGIRDALHARVHHSDGSREKMVLALRGLAELKDVEAVEAIQKLALDASQRPKIRLKAASALGQLTSEGLTQQAEQLLADTASHKRIDRIIAARMLSGHSKKPAQTLLLKLATDPESTVAAIALARLLEIDADLVIRLVKQIIGNRDPTVRVVAVGALRERPTNGHIELLFRLLNDTDPHVRNSARKALHFLAARDEFHDTIRRLAIQTLETEQWRALEQTAILLGMLDHKPAAKSLIQTLEFHRSEPAIAAAWALKKLAVPELLPDVLELALKRTALLMNANQPRSFRVGIDLQISQLFQLFGKLKYAPAEPLLREFIPRRRFSGFESRSSAVWALGYLHEDDPKADLISAFVGRLNDLEPIPDDPRVRRMAAVSLGRMKAENALDTLELFYKSVEPRNRDIGYACAWAIRRITNKNIPPPPTPDAPQKGWFLEPIDAVTGN